MWGGPNSREGRAIGKYRLGERLGGDRRVERFLAEHQTIKRVVEVHCLAETELASGDAASRLAREARVLGAATHRNLQGVVDTGRDERGRPYVVYEALRGIPLANLIESAPNGVEPERAARLVLQVLEALRSLHLAGAVMRTLRPDDIVVEQVSAADERVKVRAGLGAALVDSDDPPAISVRYSTWLAPELRRGEPGLDPRVDFYSVGVILRQLLTGEASGDDEMVSDTARRALARACAELPEERFAHADGFLQSVGLLLPTERRPAREQMKAPADPLAADLQYLHLRRVTRHGPREAEPPAESRVSLLVVLLAIEAIYRRFGADVWSELSANVEGAEALLPGSGNTPVHLSKGVPTALFAQILKTVDRIAGEGHLELVPGLGEQVASRGLRKLLPDLPPNAAPSAIVAGFPYLWSCISLDGEAEVVSSDTHAARLSVCGQTAPRLELAGLMGGILREGLSQLGAQEVEVVLITAEALGDGRDLYGASWR